MTRFLQTVTLLAWSLWFGGMIVLILFVMRLFGTSRAVAVEAAPVLFRTFAVYQLTVGMIACMGGTLLCIRTRRNTHAIMTLFMLGALAAALVIRSWTYRMEAIRMAGNSSGPEFQTLHQHSTHVYSLATILLLIAGIGWLLTAGSRQTIPATAPAKGSEAEAAR